MSGDILRDMVDFGTAADIFSCHMPLTTIRQS
jgi:hypothetical protein